MIFTWVSEQINQWLVNNTIYCCAGLRGYSLLLLIKASRFQIKVLLTLWCIRCLFFFFFFFFCWYTFSSLCHSKTISCKAFGNACFVNSYIGLSNSCFLYLHKGWFDKINVLLLIAAIRKRVAPDYRGWFM